MVTLWLGHGNVMVGFREGHRRSIVRRARAAHLLFLFYFTYARYPPAPAADLWPHMSEAPPPSPPRRKCTKAKNGGDASDMGGQRSAAALAGDSKKQKVMTTLVCIGRKKGQLPRTELHDGGRSIVLVWAGRQRRDRSTCSVGRGRLELQMCASPNSQKNMASARCKRQQRNETNQVVLVEHGSR
jgi:hypothetical protein